MAFFAVPYNSENKLSNRVVHLIRFSNVKGGVAEDNEEEAASKTEFRKLLCSSRKTVFKFTCNLVLSSSQINHTIYINPSVEFLPFE